MKAVSSPPPPANQKPRRSRSLKSSSSSAMSRQAFWFGPILTLAICFCAYLSLLWIMQGSGTLAVPRSSRHLVSTARPTPRGTPATNVSPIKHQMSGDTEIGLCTCLPPLSSPSPQSPRFMSHNRTSPFDRPTGPSVKLTFSVDPPAPRVPLPPASKWFPYVSGKYKRPRFNRALKDRARGWHVMFRGYALFFGVINVKPDRDEILYGVQATEPSTLADRLDLARCQYNAHRQHVQERRELREKWAKLILAERIHLRTERQAMQVHREAAREMYIQGAWMMYLATPTGESDLVVYRRPAYGLPFPSRTSAYTWKELVSTILAAVTCAYVEFRGNGLAPSLDAPATRSDSPTGNVDDAPPDIGEASEHPLHPVPTVSSSVQFDVPGSSTHVAEPRIDESKGVQTDTEVVGQPTTPSQPAFSPVSAFVTSTARSEVRVDIAETNEQTAEAEDSANVSSNVQNDIAEASDQLARPTQPGFLPVSNLEPHSTSEVVCSIAGPSTQVDEPLASPGKDVQEDVEVYNPPVTPSQTASSPGSALSLAIGRSEIQPHVADTANPPAETPASVDQGVDTDIAEVHNAPVTPPLLASPRISDGSAISGTDDEGWEIAGGKKKGRKNKNHDQQEPTTRTLPGSYPVPQPSIESSGSQSPASSPTVKDIQPQGNKNPEGKAKPGNEQAPATGALLPGAYPNSDLSIGSNKSGSSTFASTLPGHQAQERKNDKGKGKQGIEQQPAVSALPHSPWSISQPTGRVIANESALRLPTAGSVGQQEERKDSKGIEQGPASSALFNSPSSSRSGANQSHIPPSTVGDNKQYERRTDQGKDRQGINQGRTFSTISTSPSFQPQPFNRIRANERHTSPPRLSQDQLQCKKDRGKAEQHNEQRPLFNRQPAWLSAHPQPPNRSTAVEFLIPPPTVGDDLQLGKTYKGKSQQRAEQELTNSMLPHPPSFASEVSNGSGANQSRISPPSAGAAKRQREKDLVKDMQVTAQEPDNNGLPLWPGLNPLPPKASGGGIGPPVSLPTRGGNSQQSQRIFRGRNAKNALRRISKANKAQSATPSTQSSGSGSFDYNLGKSTGNGKKMKVLHLTTEEEDEIAVEDALFALVEEWSGPSSGNASPTSKSHSTPPPLGSDPSKLAAKVRTLGTSQWAPSDR